MLSVKRNIIYYAIDTISGLLYSLVSFPYASRILLADGIGQVHFFNSIISYVVLFTTLGIPMYGVRQIARVRDNADEMAQTTAEILSLHLILVSLGYFVVFILCCFVGKIQENIPLFLILSGSVLLNAIGCPWFFKGNENFRFITIRSLVVRVVALAFLFLFVRTKDDLLLYGVYWVVGSAGASVLNVISLRKYGITAAFRERKLHIWRHIHGILAVFAFNVAISVYVNIDAVMLGFMGTSAIVGYYTAATKVAFTLVTLVTSITAVLTPRASHLVANGEMDEFAKVSKKSYDFVIWSGFPLAMGVAIISSTVIRVFCGDGYESAILTLQLLTPLIVVKGLSNMLGRQVLYPQGHINWVIVSTCVGIVINVLFNLFLIPRYEQNGAAIATVVAECSIFMTLILGARSFFPFHLFDRHILWYVLSTIVMAVLCIWLASEIQDLWRRIVIIPIIGSATYFMLMFLAKDSLTIELLKNLKLKK